jgi:Carbohydrate esterase, sialic acid-specific acetylesterase
MSWKFLVYFAVCAVVVSAIGAAYLFGAVSYHRGIWPMPNLRALKQTVSPFVPANGEVTDELGRLVGYKEKREVRCPAQTNRTMVLLSAGQSNAANSGGQRYAGRQRVINFFAGKCYAASSPLLGTTGINGDSWTLLSNKIVERELADQVILVSTAMSGTGIAQWQEGGKMNLMLQSVLADVKLHYTITHVLWHQGEWDFGGGMTKDQYTDKFMSFVESIRKIGIDAPIYVSVATRCEYVSALWTADNPVASAQKALPDNREDIFAGVDTDALLDPLDRMDDCHFSQTGQEKFAEAWVGILSKARSLHSTSDAESKP